MRRTLASASFVAQLLASASAGAASLQVSPVLLDIVAAGAAATSITLHNAGARPINAQVRVFRWTQVDGQDRLEETADVVAAPPILALRPGADYTVRVVRLSRAPVSGEESYRVLADELPDPEHQAPGTVALLVRHSVPLFFRAADASAPRLAWSVESASGHLTTRVVNEGDRRVRIARLRVADGGGRQVSYGEGLVGYVLGHSATGWTSRSDWRGAPRSARVSADADTGPLSVPATLAPAR